MRNENGATTEYILILTLLLGLFLIAFWGKISRVVTERIKDVDYGIVNLKKRPGSASGSSSDDASGSGSSIDSAETDPSSTSGSTGWSNTGWGGSGSGTDGIPTTRPTPIFTSTETHH